MNTIILANGAFPESEKLLKLLDSADRVICCDGAVNNLVKYGKEPYIIIGDLDSVEAEIRSEYKNILVHDSDQETNDLTKAVNWCVSQGITDVVIMGATGRREDHTIGNVSLLAGYARIINVKMVSDNGVFIPVSGTTSFSSVPGQQVSVFSLNPELEISSEGLKYPLKNLKLTSWWMGTLNEALAASFTLKLNGKGDVIVFLAEKQ